MSELIAPILSKTGGVCSSMCNVYWILSENIATSNTSHTQSTLIISEFTFVNFWLMKYICSPWIVVLYLHLFSNHVLLSHFQARCIARWTSIKVSFCIFSPKMFYLMYIIKNAYMVVEWSNSVLLIDARECADNQKSQIPV